MKERVWLGNTLILYYPTSGLIWRFLRRNFLNNDEMTARVEGTNERDRVCIPEIWCECFGKSKGDLKRMESNEIAAIMARIEGWENLGRTLYFGKHYGYSKAYVR